eukprot:3090746-Lingulodinium_polyedra.AAC.1
MSASSAFGFVYGCWRFATALAIAIRVQQSRVQYRLGHKDQVRHRVVSAPSPAVERSLMGTMSDH